jgi:hypothetical protein
MEVNSLPNKSVYKIAKTKNFTVREAGFVYKKIVEDARRELTKAGYEITSRNKHVVERLAAMWIDNEAAYVEGLYRLVVNNNTRYGSSRGRRCIRLTITNFRKGPPRIVWLEFPPFKD